MQDLSRLPPAYLVQEIDRLLELESRSTTALRKHLASLKAKIPQDILALFNADAMKQEAAEVHAARQSSRALQETLRSLSQVQHSSQPTTQTPNAPSKQMHRQSMLLDDPTPQPKRRRLVGKQSAEARPLGAVTAAAWGKIAGVSPTPDAET